MEFEEMSNGYQEFMKDWENEHHRFRSYDVCKTYFDEHYGKPLTPSVKEEFCIRLFYYLASWGMFRGNDWLIWKSYSVFDDVADVLFNNEYAVLKDINPLSEDFKQENYNMVMTLYDAVKEALKQTIDEDDTNYPPDKIRNNEVSLLMVSKILLGTYGCMIAYDRFALTGLRALKGRVPTNMDVKVLFSRTCDLIEKNKESLKDIMKHMENYKDPKTGKPINYTVFKILDMILWQYGKEKDDKKKAAKAQANK